MTSTPEGGDRIAAPLFREAYFPTFIFFRDLPGAEAMNPGLLDAARALRAADPKGIERSNIAALGGWHSTTDLARQPAFAGIGAAIRRTAAELGESLGYDPDWPLDIDNFWTIINPPGSFNRAHVHPGSQWSGVYYVQAPEQAGRISFTDPRIIETMSQARFDPARERTADTWTEVFFEPIPGRVILFPSWLYHGVEVNTCPATGPEAERVILSFNLVQRRARPG